MKLIKEIIGELVNNESPLSVTLVKTKVLASKIGNQQLADWVTHEVYGYPQGMAVPSYRSYPGQFVGNYINGNYKYTNHQIPVPSNDKTFIKEISICHFTESVSVLESFANDSSKAISQKLELSAVTYWEDKLRDQNPYLQISSISKTVPSSVIIQMLATIKAKLLEFLLGVEQEFGDGSELDLSSNKSKVSKIMNQTIINNTGDGNVVNTGDNATVNAEINITKGDKQALANKLTAEGIANDDVVELIEVVDEEQPVNGIFGSKVREWSKKMYSKAIDGAWQISTGAAGGIIAEALSKYYGL